MNPHGWPEYIYITEYKPEGKSHTGDLLDIGGAFSVARWAIPTNEPLRNSGTPWIPSMKKWDHVRSMPPSNVRLPYSDQLWEVLETLAEKMDDFEKALRETVLAGGADEAIVLLILYTKELRGERRVGHVL